MNIMNKKGLTISQFVLLAIIAIAVILGGAWLAKMPANESTEESAQVVAPDEIIFALANVEGDVGSIEEQRADLYDIYEALRIGTATSKSLGKSGNTWLGELRNRVNVREAMESWQELQTLADESSFRKLTRQEIGKISRLRKIIEAQILSRYAKEEGLHCNHGQVGNLVSQITQK
jgi:hypothetical protein